jgi:hypothetical protein
MILLNSSQNLSLVDPKMTRRLSMARETANYTVLGPQKLII